MDYHKTMRKMFHVSAKLIVNDSDIDKPFWMNASKRFDKIKRF